MRKSWRDIMDNLTKSNHTKLYNITITSPRCPALSDIQRMERIAVAENFHQNVISRSATQGDLLYPRSGIQFA